MARPCLGLRATRAAIAGTGIVLQFTFALLFVQEARADTPCEEVVCVEVVRTNDAVTFYATSRADGVSISFSVSAVNMEPATPPVLTRPLVRGRTELMTLKTIPGKQPKFEHGYFWEWGVAGATHDDRVSYRLPFESGKKFRLSQGPNGALSHQSRFAYDFPMPTGTPVCAARAGLVTDVVDRFGEGGDDLKYSELANHILILHQDGTLGVYLHLLRGGMRAKPGDWVEAGAIIGLSGNSGRSTGPHLHLEVFRLNAAKRETVPIAFRTTEGHRVVLVEGNLYRAD